MHFGSCQDYSYIIWQNNWRGSIATSRVLALSLKQKGPLKGDSREARVVKATLAEPIGVIELFKCDHLIFSKKARKIQ